MLKLEEVEKLKLNTNDTHDLQEEQEHLKIMNKTLEDDKHILTMENQEQEGKILDIQTKINDIDLIISSQEKLIGELQLANEKLKDEN